MKYTAAHCTTLSSGRSDGSHQTEGDTTSSGDDSDNGDFFSSSPESGGAKSESQRKSSLAQEPPVAAAPSPSPDPEPSKAGESTAGSESDDEDKYDESSKAESEDEKGSDASSESTPATSEGSDGDSDASSDDEEEDDVEDAKTEHSSGKSSVAAASENAAGKQTEKKKGRNDQKTLRISLLNLYPKSLSLVGLNNEKEKDKAKTTPSRPKSSASARPCLQTRVLERSRSLEEFTATLPERVKREGWRLDSSELTRLNKAVYEAWYFHKEQQVEIQKQKEEEKKLLEKTRKPRKLFQKTVPRKTRKINMSEKVKMNIDKTDEEDKHLWEWLKKKLIKMRKAKVKSEAKAKSEREAQENRKASKIEEGSLAYAAWKKQKDEEERQRRRQEKREAKEKAMAEEQSAEENRVVASKVFEQYKERVTAEEREEAQLRRRQQRRVADRTIQMLDARDRQAQARYHQWLQQASERAFSRPDSAGRHTPPPPRPPWYPGGVLPPGRAAGERPLAPPRSARPASVLRASGARGWRPCHQSHCPACPCAPPATEVVSSSREDARLAVDQPVTCASRRAVYVIRCLFCDQQYVGWTLHSVRAAFASQLRSLQEEGGSTLAEHVTEHRRESGRFVPLTECIQLTGVRAFPETASRHAVADFAHVAKEILGTVSPDGINRA